MSTRPFLFFSNDRLPGYHGTVALDLNAKASPFLRSRSSRRFRFNRYSATCTEQFPDGRQLLLKGFQSKFSQKTEGQGFSGWRHPFPAITAHSKLRIQSRADPLPRHFHQPEPGNIPHLCSSLIAFRCVFIAFFYFRLVFRIFHVERSKRSGPEVP
jgi:hypothetical protein